MNRDTARTHEISVALGAVSLLALMILVAFYNKTIIWDETHYIASARDFIRKGLTVDWVHWMYPGSAGPAVSMLYATGVGLVGNGFRGGRITSLVFLLLTMTMLGLILRRQNKFKVWSSALQLAACPIILALGGLIMPEISGLFFLCVFLYFLQEALSEAGNTLHWLAAGLALGITVLCRQNLLVILLPALAIAAWQGRNRASLFVFLICTALLTVPVFFIWGGLVPPRSNGISEAGLSLFHGVLALGTTGVIFFCLYNPTRLAERGKLCLGLVGAAVGVLYWLKLPLSKVFFGEIVNGRLSAPAMEIYQTITNAVAVAFAILLVLEMVGLLRSKKISPFEQILCWSILLICISASRVTYAYSVRYVVATVPMMILLFPDRNKDKLRPLMTSIGSLIGIAGILLIWSKA